MVPLARLENILPAQLKDALNTNYEHDLQPLVVGRLHTLDGKEWLVRMGIPGDPADLDSITELFFLLHSGDQTCIYKAWGGNGSPSFGSGSFGSDRSLTGDKRIRLLFAVLRSEEVNDLEGYVPKFPSDFSSRVRDNSKLKNVPDTLLNRTERGVHISTKVAALLIVLALAGGGLFATYKTVRYFRASRKIGG